MLLLACCGCRGLLLSQLPLLSQWTKHTNYELGARVPLLISAPFLTGSVGVRADGFAEVGSPARQLISPLTVALARL